MNVASAARLADVPARWRPVALAGAAAVAWAILAAILPHGMPAGIVLLGAVLGSLTGLSAVGLVLVYRASRVVNFSQASLGSAAGVLAILVFISWHWNYFLCLTLGVVVAAGTGALVDRVVIRRFFWAPRLILTLATIGLAQVLGGIELGLPSLFGQPLVTNSFRTPLSSSFTLDPVLFTGNHVLIVVIVPVVAATLAWFLTKTSLGVAIRAASENAERALVLGIPVRRLSTIVWAIAAGLSALAVMLTAPIQALPPTVLAGPALLLPALAAAVLARMEHLPAAFVAGVGIGILQQVTFWTTSRSSATDVAFLVVIMGALLLQRDRLSRADDASASSWLATGETAPIPAELRRLPEVVWARRGVIAAVAAVALVAPALLTVSQVNLVGTVALVYALIGVSLVVLTGWSGQLSLGQFALAGVGGVVAANLLDSGVDLILVLAGASLGGAVGALVVGLPALRIRGLFLGVTTLALAVAMSTYFLNPSYFPSLLPSDLERPVLLTRFDLSSEITLYYFALVVVAAAAWTASNLRASRVGRLLIAVRDNERAARARGVDATLVKLGAFAFSGGLAGLAGGLLVLVFLAVGSGSFSAKQSFDAFAMVVVGGLTSVSGAIAGAFVLRWTQYAIGGSLQLIVTGAGVLVLLLAFPGGIGQLLTSARDHYLRRVAARRRIVVPSLIADVATAEPVAASSEELYAIVARRRAARTQTNPAAAEVEQLRQEGEALRRRLEDLDVHACEIVALLGTNGAGKSTLLRAVTGLTPPSAGTIELDGQVVTGADPAEIAALGVGFMPGGRAVFPGLSVRENLELAGWLYRSDPQRVDAAIEEALGLFPMLRDRLGERVALLSGGQQQMVALAQTLVAKPRLLLLDELSLGLAPVVVGQLLEVVRQLRDDGLTVVLVEQSVNVALDIADRAVFMEKGEVRFTGPATKLRDRDDLLRSVFIGRSTAPAGEPPEPAPAGDANAPEVVLRAGGLGCSFGGVRAVNEVELDVHAGEIIGIVGANGAGKTTLLDLLSGFVSADSGTVELGGVDVSGLAPHRRALLGLARTFQDARLFPSLTVAENLMVALDREAPNRDPVAAALRLAPSILTEIVVSDEADELIEALGLGAFRDKRVSQLSTGSRRVVELASLVAQDARVLLLDEPSAGIAQREAEALGPLLRRLRDATGAAMVIVEHDVPLLRATCDRLVAMDLGSVIADGRPDDVLADSLVIAAYLGTSTVAVQRSGVKQRSARGRVPLQLAPRGMGASS